MAKILVIGATSLVGKRLYEALGPERADFTTRKPRRKGEIVLDLAHPKAFDAKGYTDVIVTTPIWLLTEDVLEVLWAQGMKRIVAFSSTSRFSKTASPEPLERAVAERLSGAEDRLMAFGPKHDVAWTILRPTLIWDEGKDANVSRIRSFMNRFGFFPVCGEARGLRQPVHARDLAAAAIAALGAEKTRDKAYNLSGGETLTYAEMAVRVGASGHRQASVVRLPEWVWQAGFAVVGLFGSGDSLKNNLEMARRMNVDLVFDHDEAERDFGYTPAPFRPEFS